MSDDSSVVLLWWQLLAAVSVVNLVAWVQVTRRTLREERQDDPDARRLRRRLMFLSALFVAGCAFRSLLPHSEGQRISLHGASSAVVTRAVATVAELALATQWSLVLAQWAHEERSRAIAWVARLVVPAIVVAEIASWYTALTTNFLGSVIEESIWAASAAAIAASLFWLRSRSAAPRRRFFGIAAFVAAGYVAYMVTQDVPMYFDRWCRDQAASAQYLSVGAGWLDAHLRSDVTRGWDAWRDEIPWMTLYFSVGVWVSIALIRAPLRRAQPAR